MEYWFYRALIGLAFIVGIKLLAGFIWYALPKGKFRDALFRIR